MVDLADLAPVDAPRTIDPGRSRSDRVFRGSTRSIGVLVLLITGSIGLFLGLQAAPTIRHYGWGFLTHTAWQPEFDRLGIAAVLVGTVEVAFVAIAIAFPLALLTAIYISEFAPARIKGFCVALVDLMAAVPSIIWGIWGLLLIEPHALFLSRWISAHFGWLPLFAVHTPANTPDVFTEDRYTASAFMAGIAVSMMVLPMACAVMRGVFAQAPIGEREAAMALGATPWGVVRTVVLPFGAGGIIGGTMLALGRALGETIAVVLIISPEFVIKPRILEVGTSTISSLIAGRFGDATTAQLSALLAAGFVLFLITLLTNTVAATIVARTRSGAVTSH